jgi:acylphosphatase
MQSGSHPRWTPSNSSLVADPLGDDTGVVTGERVHARVRGVVQGVSYRANAAARARELGLLGWVRNRDDGSVELLAEGPRAQLDALIEWCEIGPRFARVDAVEREWSAARGEFEQFEILR